MDKYANATLKTLEPELREVSRAVSTRYPNSQTILFGSFARGEQHEDSDLDFCVLLPEITGNSRDVLVSLRGIISDVIPGMPIDVVSYTYHKFDGYAQSKSSMAADIKDEGVYLNEL